MVCGSDMSKLSDNFLKIIRRDGYLPENIDGSFHIQTVEVVRTRADDSAEHLYGGRAYQHFVCLGEIAFRTVTTARDDYGPCNTVVGVMEHGYIDGRICLIGSGEAKGCP